MHARGAFISHVSSYNSNLSSFAISSSSLIAPTALFSTITICKVDKYDDQSSYTMIRHFSRLMEQFHEPTVHQNSFCLIKSDTKEGTIVPIQRTFQVATLKRLQQRRVLIERKHREGWEKPFFSMAIVRSKVAFI